MGLGSGIPDPGPGVRKAPDHVSRIRIRNTDFEAQFLHLHIFYSRILSPVFCLTLWISVDMFSYWIRAGPKERRKDFTFFSGKFLTYYLFKSGGKKLETDLLSAKSINLNTH
jgi:hypothetical protein